MFTNTKLAALLVAAALLCSWSPRSAAQGQSYSVSTYHHESFGPDGIITGRSGYKDSSGKSRFTQYHVGKDGRRKFIRDDPEGDVEARSLLPDPSKLAFPGFPGLAGDPHLDFFRSLGFPKGALLPSFPQDLLPRDLLPPSAAGGDGQGVTGRSGVATTYPATTPDFFRGLLPPNFAKDFFPPDLFPQGLQPPSTATPANTKLQKLQRTIPPPPVPPHKAGGNYYP